MKIKVILPVFSTWVESMVNLSRTDVSGITSNSKVVCDGESFVFLPKDLDISKFLKNDYSSNSRSASRNIKSATTFATAGGKKLECSAIRLTKEEMNALIGEGFIFENIKNQTTILPYPVHRVIEQIKNEAMILDKEDGSVPEEGVKNEIKRRIHWSSLRDRVKLPPRQDLKNGVKLLPEEEEEIVEDGFIIQNVDGKGAGFPVPHREWKELKHKEEEKKKLDAEEKFL